MANPYGDYQDDWTPRDPKTGQKKSGELSTVPGSQYNTQVEPDKVIYGDPNTPPPVTTPGAVTPPAQVPMQAAGNTPDYYDASNPVHQAVWSAFQAKGIQPRDQADFQYWVDHINQSGGLANGYQNSGGTGTWAQRMASGSGGVGDYRTGGAPIQGGTMGGGFSSGQYKGGTGSLFSNALGTDQANSLYAKLLDRANQSLAIDPRTDPIMRAQTDAFDAARQRGDRNTLSSIAESAGANTNLEAIKRSAGEASGQATSGFQAGLAQNELNARRQEIQQALSGAAGLLTSQQQMALQEELSNLDRAQQQWQFEAGLGQNESQFSRTLGQNAYQFDINDQYRNSPIAWA